MELQEKYLDQLGWTKHKQPRKDDNTKYTGKEFCQILNRDILAVGNNIIANIPSDALNPYNIKTACF